MEIVKSEPDGVAHHESDVTEPHGWVSRLLAWCGSTGDRATDRDPTLWMHRDVTTEGGTP